MNNDKFNINSLKVSPESCFIASGGDDNCVKIWDVNKQMILCSYNEHLQSINCVRWSPNSNYFASASNDNKINIYDIRCDKSIKNITAHSNSVTSISFHPSKKYLVSCSLDSTIKIWDLINNNLLCNLYGHEGPINSVCFNHTGEYICSGGIDSNLLLWKYNSESDSRNQNSKKASKNKSKKKYRSKSTNKYYMAKYKKNKNDDKNYPDIFYGNNINNNDNDNYYYNNGNIIFKNNKNINEEFASPNIESKEINNAQNLNQNKYYEIFSNNMAQNLISMINKLNDSTQKMNQRIYKLESYLGNLPNVQMKQNLHSKDTNNINNNNLQKINNNIKENNENNKVEEDYEANKEALKEAKFYYHSLIKKYENNNPVEIFEDINNHVEDIRQEVSNNQLKMEKKL